MNRLLALLVLLVGPFSIAGSAEGPLVYGPEAGEEFAYEIKIAVKHQGTETRYEGITRYRADTVNDEYIALTYRGGLAEKSPAPGQSPISRVPQSMPGFFGQPTLTGTSLQTNVVTLSRRGVTLALRGTSQLPFLLGNVSQLPFQVLPPAELAAASPRPGLSWTADSTVAITETKRPRFDSPVFLRQDEAKAVRAGQEETRYQLESVAGNIVKIKVTTQLSSPDIEGEVNIETQGGGMWEFDTKTRMPHAADMQLTVKFANENVQLTLPISVKFQRLSTEELSRREAEAKRVADEATAKLAEKQREAEKPLTATEKSDLLKMLRSRSPVEVLRALHQLTTRRPLDPDPEIVAAIRGKLNDPNRAVQMSANQALTHWSPEFEQWSKANKAYQDGRSVQSSGLPVDQRTPLVVGQLVQVKAEFRDRWAPAEVVGLMPDSSVAVKLLGSRGRFSESSRPSVYARRDIELAPPEVDQPGAPGLAGTAASASAQPAAARLWSDVSGQFRVEAAFVAMEGDSVKLRRTDGREISVSLERLSEQDRKIASDLGKAARGPAPVNPFE